MISLKQLTYALAVEKTLHFKKAADACNVSQSALSTALTELEKQLGVQLFERNNKQVLVTPQGQLLLDKARAIKLQVDDLYQLAQVQKTPLSNPMTLGVIPTIGPYLLPKVLPALRQQHPDFQLTIIEEQSHVLVDMVRRGEIDTAILAMPYALDGLLAFDFWQEDFYLAMHKDDKLAGNSEISHQDLIPEHLMLLKDGHCLKDHALSACNLGGVETDYTLNGTSLVTLVQMVAGKMGTTLVPEMALEQLVNSSAELTAIHLNEPGPHRTISFICRPNYIGVHNIDALKAIFTQQLKD